ncbi:MAG: hypothetical protein RQ824_02725 [bacterium]|nr:hypothetical protein [bacterium]
MKYFKSQKGALTFGGLVFLIIVVASGYVGIKMGMPLFTNWQVKEIFRNEVERIKVDTEPVVREVVLKRLEEHGVKLLPDKDFEDGLRIFQEDEYNETGPYIMEASYTIDVDFIGGHRYTYKFSPRKVAKK